MSVASDTHGVEWDWSLAGGGRRRAPRATMPSDSSSWFWMLWAFIGLVSVLDAWLVCHFRVVMPFTEENLLCRFLISLDTEHLSVFLRAKAAGTLTVLSILTLVFERFREYSMPITGGVAAWQAGLMVYFVL